MLWWQTGLKEASCQLCLSEKVLRSLVWMRADIMGLFALAQSTPCLALINKPGKFIRKEVRVKAYTVHFGRDQLIYKAKIENVDQNQTLKTAQSCQFRWYKKFQLLSNTPGLQILWGQFSAHMNQQSYFILTCVSLFMFFCSLCSTSARSLQISCISPCQQIFQEAVPRYKILCTVPILVVKSYLPLTTPHCLDSVLVDVMTCVVALAS